ncbi:MAG: glycosyltransferase [Ignavibacteria bacterium]
MVSIIIPTYNRSKLLLECVQAILRQTYDNFEILIIDDGSTDDTEKNITALNDNRVIYNKFNKIGNLSVLRNYGVNQSKGEIVAFCDDDDLWLQEKLEIQLKFIDSFNMICSNAEIVNLEGSLISEKYFSDFVTNKQLNTSHLFLKNFVITSTVLLKKNILPQIPFDTLGYGSTAEDYDLWLKLSLNNLIYFINKNLIKYRFHSNLSHTQYPLIFVNSINILNKYKMLVPKRYRRYANWGVLKFRKDYIILNLLNRRLFIVVKEILKMILAFFDSGLLSLLFFRILNPKKHIIYNLDKNTFKDIYWDRSKIRLNNKNI